MPKFLYSQFINFICTRLFIVLYSLFGFVIQFFYFVKSSTSSDNEILNILMTGYYIALPICLASEYFFYSTKYNKIKSFLLTIFAFLIGALADYQFKNNFTPLIHLCCISVLIFVLSPKSVLQKEELGIHWVLSLIIKLFNSLIITLIVTALLLLLNWVLRDLLLLQIPKTLVYLIYAFLFPLLPIFLFTFLNIEPDKVEGFFYKIPNRIERLLNLLFKPLVIIYIIVLLIYLVKILVEKSLPRGMVSVPIGVAYLLFILLRSLFTYQFNQKKGIWKFEYLLHWCFLPLFILMGFGIYERINEYGFTIYRFYLVLLYMLAIISFLLWTKFNRLELRKIILVCVISLSATIWGPFNPLQISIYSQTKLFYLTLKKYSNQYNTFEDFNIKIWKLRDVRKIYDSLEFIESNGGLENFVTNENINQLIAPRNNFELKISLIKKLQLKLKELNIFSYEYQELNQPIGMQNNKIDSRDCISYWSDLSDIENYFIDIKSYDYFLNISNEYFDKFEFEFNIPGKKDKVYSIYENGPLVIGEPNEQNTNVIKLDFVKAIENFKSQKIDNQNTLKPVVLSGSSAKYKAKMIILRSDINCHTKYLKAILLLKFK